MQDALNWFIRDKDGKVLVWQNPNLALWLWVGLKLLSLVVGGWWGQLISLIALGAIIGWSSLELLRGQSYFRRTLGLIVLIFSLTSLFKG